MTEDEITEFERWVNGNMAEGAPDDVPDESMIDEDYETSLTRLRGDSTLSSRIKPVRHMERLLKIVTVILLVALVLGFFIKREFSPITVIGPSMEPTFKSGNILVTTTDIEKEKLDYDTIICFEKNGSKTIIKRIVGLPGDTLHFKDGKLYVNGIERKDDFPVMEEYPEETITLKDEEYYCLGDNRNYSLDSRGFGPVLLSEITNIVTSDSPNSQDFKKVYEAYKKYSSSPNDAEEKKEN